MEDNYFKYRYSGVLKIGIVKWLLMLTSTPRSPDLLQVILKAIL